MGRGVSIKSKRAAGAHLQRHQEQVEAYDIVASERVCGLDVNFVACASMGVVSY